jgi:hypothetical protein
MRAGPHWMKSLPLVTVLALTKCSRPPNDTIRTVTRSFEKLEAMKARDYVPRSYQNAEQAYAEAMTEIEMQQQKSPLSRSYIRAGDLLSKAKVAMEQTMNQAEDRRDQLAREAAGLIEEAKAAFASAESEADDANVSIVDAQIDMDGTGGP